MVAGSPEPFSEAHSTIHKKRFSFERDTQRKGATVLSAGVDKSVPTADCKGTVTSKQIMYCISIET